MAKEFKKIFQAITPGEIQQRKDEIFSEEVVSIQGFIQNIQYNHRHGGHVNPRRYRPGHSNEYITCAPELASIEVGLELCRGLNSIYPNLLRLITERHVECVLSIKVEPYTGPKIEPILL